MAGYNDTRNLIIEALMGRQAGTEIQPEKHQAYALNMLDYVRSVELVSSSTLVGLAEESTVPIQPNQGKVCYIAGVGQDRTVTFSNFIDDEGNPISITTGEMEGVFVILLWNMEHWVAYTFNTNIISNTESANFYYGYNIRKTYASVAAMNADSVNPIGTDGRLIKIGELVTVVNSTTPAENGYYSYEGSENGWLLQSGFSFEVVQTTGTDINKPMSQKAVTDELALKANQTDFVQLAGDVSQIELSLEGYVINKRIHNTTGVWEDASNYVFLTTLFPISSEPSITVAGVLQLAPRYFDENKDYLSSTYTLDAKYLMIGATKSGITTKEDVYGIRFVINGVGYTLGNNNPFYILGEINKAKKEIVENKLDVITQRNDIQNIKEFLVNSGSSLQPLLNYNIVENGIRPGSPEYTFGLGRISFENYFTADGAATASARYGGVDKAVLFRYYDSEYNYLGIPYTSEAKYFRVVITFSQGVEISDIDLGKLSLTINGVEYKMTDSLYSEPIRLTKVITDVSLLYANLPKKEDWLPAYINRNIDVPGITNVDGRIAVDYYFPISSKPSAVALIDGISKTVVFRYYDADKNWLGLSYTEQAEYVRCVILFSDGTLIIDENILNDIIFTFNGQPYQFGSKYEELATKKDLEEIVPPPSSEIYYNNFMQIFPKYTVIGDSLSAGFMSIDGITIGSSTARPTKNNWPGYIEKRIGQTITNLAIGSSHTHHWRYTDGPSVPTNVADISEANISTDAYIIALGQNDLSGVTIGSSNDIVELKDNNEDTFYGNYDFIVRKLWEFNPNAHIFMLTLPNIGTSGSTRNNFNNAIRYISTLYPTKSHLIDLFELYPTEFSTGLVAANHIGGHYNPMAYNYISVLIEKAISNYIYNNNTLFKVVPYYL